jgi:pectinesterase
MVRKNGGVYTAPSTPQEAKFGLVFLQCHFDKTGDVEPMSATLMRPWRQYGMTALIGSTVGDAVKPAGWSAWGGKELTCRAYESGSVDESGKPAEVSARASWSHQLTADEASAYTAEAILGDWVRTK